VHCTADRDSAVIRRRGRAYRPAAVQGRLFERAGDRGSGAAHRGAGRPGYGSLSQDPEFAEIRQANDITFIDPAPRVMPGWATRQRPAPRWRRRDCPCCQAGTGALASFTDAEETAAGAAAAAPADPALSAADDGPSEEQRTMDGSAPTD
jgi:acetyl-CoA carboxylase biotin carboxylase subunit